MSSNLNLDFGITQTAQCVFFWQPDGWASNWTPSVFVVDGVQYNCAEQYMMASKAKLFNDEKTYELIMNATDPKTQKSLGRKVKNFDEEIWKDQCSQIMLKGLTEKFSQNPDFKEKLLATGSKTLAEASPFDKIWGIGISPTEAARKNITKDKFKGLNLLGNILMQVRDALNA